MVRRFSSDMFRLIRWSIFQPTKLSTYMQSLHPELTVYTGFIQQLWLARSSPAIRRFLGLQVTVWSLLGLLSFALMVVVRVATSSLITLSLGEVAFEAIFGIVGTLIVAVTLCAVGGVAVGVTGSVVGGLLLGLSLGLAFGLTGGGTAGVALGLAGGILLGIVGSIFDHLRRPTMVLSSWSYWGRAMVGFIFTAISVGLFALILAFVIALADILLATLVTRMILGAVFGLLGGGLVIISTSLGMRFETGRLDLNRLKWNVLDILLLGTVGGIAGGFVISAPPGISGAVALIILWGILVGIGGGLAMQAGNGISATLAAAGLTWSLVAGPTTLITPGALFAAGTTLLAGLFSYVRLPICMVEVPLARWQYLYMLRHRKDVFNILRRTPVYWDNIIFYPLPALDQFLLATLRADRQAGLKEVAFMANSFRQGWAANRAQLTFAAETLANCNSPTMIAAAPSELDWLADEVMNTLGQGIREIVPRLLGIASGVRTTIDADNPYSRRLGYREALEGLDTLQRRLPSLGQQAIHWWQPVIDQWQQVLLNELETVSTTTTITTTENPYQPGNPLQLTRKELFKGRRGLRDAVVNALLERHRPTLVLHGPRRMGKTSFLLQLPALLPGNTVPVFLDLQRPTATQNTAAFFYSITRAISRDARPYRLQVDPPQRNSFQDSPFETFAEWLEDVALPAFQDFNVLLTFDEFEKLGEAVESGRLDTRVFDELRYLIQHQTQLALLFAGVQTLDELGPAWSSYFINIKPLTIGYLRPEQAEELIRRPDTGADFNLTYADDVVQAIMAHTFGHPYLLQLICSAVVEECNANGALTVDSVLLNQAWIRALDQGEPYFRNIWDEMAGPTGQSLLRRIAEQDSGLTLPASPALDRLLRRRVIRQDGAGYQVEIPLVRRWVVERAPDEISD